MARIITLLQRLCWNQRDWKLPDGEIKRDGGYAQKNGFGHEEWNFQTDDACEGYVYGYLRYRPSAKILKASGGRFEIAFWSLHPQTRQKFLVGFYHRATPTGPVNTAVLNRHFVANGIYDRRATELAIVPHLSRASAKNEILRSVKRGTFNFKCKTEDVELLQQRVLLPKKIKDRTVGQYFSTPTIIDGRLDASALVVLARRKSKRLSGTSAPLIEDSYFRESPARLKLIVPRHKKLANQFSAWLTRRGYKRVTKEVQYVDVEFFDRKKMCRAELKTCYAVTTSKAIREAVGQLLEYNFRDGEPPADRWFIVLDQQPSPADMRFLERLVKIGLPLSICWLRPTRGFEIRELRP